MKKILALALLSVAAYTGRAQTTTNLDYRIQVETVTAGLTNKTTTNWRFDYGTKKEAVKVDGVNFAYAAYVVSQGTNTPLAIGPWLKQQHNALLTDYANQKQQADYAALLLKLTSLLTVNSDLLTAGDLTSLNTIAAKAP